MTGAMGMTDIRMGRRIAVIGSGISGLSAAWLLSKQHDVVLYEAENRPGGHTRTVDVDTGDGAVLGVDTGFIVFNDRTYPNLIAMFEHFGVPTRATDMSFAVSLDDGKLEYAAGDRIWQLFAQPSNLFSRRFWSMLRNLVRFYREAAARMGGFGDMTLGQLLEQGQYGDAFRDDHLLPMAAAIWSAPAQLLLDYPAEAFVRFCSNHGLLDLGRRPKWRTVVGGSQVYVDRVLADFDGELRLASPVARIERRGGRVTVTDQRGHADRFDEVVIAAHGNQALAMLADPGPQEAELLGAFRYSSNLVVLHQDAALMPKRRMLWGAWNYFGRRHANDATGDLCVSYWMNQLQGYRTRDPLIVTLNPHRAIDRAKEISRTSFDHPIFDHAAMDAQRRIWAIQGQRNTFYCGAHLGAGFHEDGLQSGLAVAEMLGARRPWTVEDPNGRLAIDPVAGVAAAREAAA
ncbi:FAD-dependent oxidoreductase [Sphingomonas histidinilytica]|uniref:Predicted NAD/FAD-binding protein n=2 Tax=Rhizorhabdus histidinilytica TaxID=439228 RepID=A0A1T4ZVY8_9SPHN|nr:FAD-dependent oxidoreductase [Rhizorhabdus histidinilytica]MBO9377548.1 FAD-dependent oxidoreductase [Rhizorhabdus histidinilytica]QEH78607.1 FAD-dependent oxidoreductase [Sphingomonas sp. C8-2]SKB26513.1 Predicted NAD/FAD-binding protein [Rhizorhabdus histidinilytica]